MDSMRECYFLVGLDYFFCLAHNYLNLFCRGIEQFMLRFPQHVNMVKSDDGHTALHIAAANDHLDIVHLLASMV